MDMRTAVTPFAGVWIEITVLLFDAVIVMSLPSRECGLKSSYICHELWEAMSLPSRECGLKLLDHN